VFDEQTRSLCSVLDDRNQVGDLSLKYRSAWCGIAGAYPCAISSNHMYMLVCQQGDHPRPGEGKVIATSLKGQWQRWARGDGPAKCKGIPRN
jgi:hypothetical protein